MPASSPTPTGSTRSGCSTRTPSGWCRSACSTRRRAPQPDLPDPRGPGRGGVPGGGRLGGAGRRRPGALRRQHRARHADQLTRGRTRPGPPLGSAGASYRPAWVAVSRRRAGTAASRTGTVDRPGGLGDRRPGHRERPLAVHGELRRPEVVTLTTARRCWRTRGSPSRRDRRRLDVNSSSTPSSNVHSHRAVAVTVTVNPRTSNGSVSICSGSPAAKIVGRLTMPPSAGWNAGIGVRQQVDDPFPDQLPHVGHRRRPLRRPEADRVDQLPRRRRARPEVHPVLDRVSVRAGDRRAGAGRAVAGRIRQASRADDPFAAVAVGVRRGRLAESAVRTDAGELHPFCHDGSSPLVPLRRRLPTIAAQACRPDPSACAGMPQVPPKASAGN